MTKIWSLKKKLSELKQTLFCILLFQEKMELTYANDAKIHRSESPARMYLISRTNQTLSRTC